MYLRMLNKHGHTACIEMVPTRVSSALGLRSPRTELFYNRVAQPARH